MGAHKYGERAAIVFSDEEISFRELHVRTKRLANALLGVAAPRDRVAILSQNRPEFVDAYFGVPMAGMGLTFLNYRLNPRELIRIILDAEASVLLVEDAYADAVARDARRADLRDDRRDDRRSSRGRRLGRALRRSARQRERRGAGRRGGRGGSRVADLHERHDGHAEGGDAQPPQRADLDHELDDPQHELGRVGRRPDDVPAVPHRRRRRGQRRADGRHARAPPRVRAPRRDDDDRPLPGDVDVVRADDAVDAAAAPSHRRLLAGFAADDRVRRLVDARRDAAPSDAAIPRRPISCRGSA